MTEEELKEIKEKITRIIEKSFELPVEELDKDNHLNNQRSNKQ